MPRQIGRDRQHFRRHFQRRRRKRRQLLAPGAWETLWVTALAGLETERHQRP